MRYSFRIITFAFIFVTLTIFCDCKASEIFNYNMHQQVLRKLSLDHGDLKNYKKIFSHLKKQDFAKVDELAAKIENPLLIGTINALKYLDKKYSSQPREL